MAGSVHPKKTQDDEAPVTSKIGTLPKDQRPPKKAKS